MKIDKTKIVGKIISKEKIEIANEIYNSLDKWKVANKAITEFFEEHPKNDDFKIVLIKVLLIDGLYKTNLKNPDAIEVSRKIVDLPSLDEDLTNNILDACIAIADQKKDDDDDDKKIFLMSFASKYCHFSTNKKFPIFDKYVGIALGISDTKKDKNVLKVFFSRIEELSKENKIDFEEIDKLLWIYGQKLYIEEQINKKRKELNKIDVNKEVKNLYKSKHDLFCAIDFCGWEKKNEQIN
jgi:hypothetical protein